MQIIMLYSSYAARICSRKCQYYLFRGSSIRSVSHSLSACWDSMSESTRNLAVSITAEGPIQRRVALSRAITLMESKKAQKKQQADFLLTYLLSQRPQDQVSALRIGFAGPPGELGAVSVEITNQIFVHRNDL